ncbi:MAG TPA: hypothetical protein VIG34_09790 [Xanthobacteraceae bacterium]|jgi:hypothetical protein
MRTIVIAAVIAVLMLTTHAEAACQVSPHRFVFGSDIELDVEITGGTRCPIAVRIGEKSTARSNRISSPPANGMVRTSGAAGVLYQPKAGFTGKDVFAFAVCGSGGGRSGCSTVRVRVTIQ